MVVVLGKTSLMTSKGFKGAGNLIKLLPSGTIFIYQFLSPILTNNGVCRLGNKYLTGFLIGICGFSCFFSSFTDSYKGVEDGETRYGVVTRKGLWPNPNDQDLYSYKLRFGDFVHACLSLLVFGVITMLDSNALKCYFPYLEGEEKGLTSMVLPPVVGAIASFVFAMFPSTRHGIGFGCALNHSTSLQEQLPK